MVAKFRPKGDKGIPPDTKVRDAAGSSGIISIPDLSCR